MRGTISGNVADRTGIAARSVVRSGYRSRGTWVRTARMSVNVAQILHQAAVRHPDRVGVVELAHAGRPREEHTFGALDQAAARLAATLPNDARIGLLADNGVACVVGWFGAVYAGATLVPIPPPSPPAESAARLAHEALEGRATTGANAGSPAAAA